MNNFERIYTQKSPNRDYFITFPEVHSAKNANSSKFPTLKMQPRTEYKEQLTERAQHEKNTCKKINQIKSEPFLKNQNIKNKLENDISPAKEYGQEYPMLFKNFNEKHHLTQLMDSNNEENFGNISPINQETVIINSFDLYGEKKKTKEKVKQQQEERKSEKPQKIVQSSHKEQSNSRVSIQQESARYVSSEREDAQFRK